MNLLRAMYPSLTCHEHLIISVHFITVFMCTIQMSIEHSFYGTEDVGLCAQDLITFALVLRFTFVEI